eukprot:gnl/TRDRNA2_/TRDRNA2_155657_c1_seq1.p1 gnl/TRDRNA2_/TRDRNA2_155657_c1~~gnl/TRDRNA2_/TRDRNA2_155657_c1_seq1.p1  ORF type:complete len:372 (+),score=78.19 gnl/TRDRNA2_/TRDRNA2_155657_c1_seq1:167-1117(+)
MTPQLQERLQAVVRLNSLGFYTHSEQLCYHENYRGLTGCGLFALGSGFNHSCDPSVTRFSLGNITVFVTNRPVKAAEELCITYIESELLCSPTSMRRQSLNRDFVCACTKCAADTNASPDEEEVAGQSRYLAVDSRVQAELTLLAPGERIEAVEAALRGETEGGDEDQEHKQEVEEQSAPAVVLGKDAQELRVVKALALMQLNKYKEALAVWRRLAAFTCNHCPPYDEALAVYAAQASASGYVSHAKRAHRVSCAAPIFSWRYRTEVEQSLATDEAKKQFWSLADAIDMPLAAAPWTEVVAAWDFAADEIPGTSGP